MRKDQTTSWWRMPRRWRVRSGLWWSVLAKEFGEWRDGSEQHQMISARLFACADDGRLQLVESGFARMDDAARRLQQNKFCDSDFGQFLDHPAEPFAFWRSGGNQNFSGGWWWHQLPGQDLHTCRFSGSRQDGADRDGALSVEQLHLVAFFQAQDVQKMVGFKPFDGRMCP